MYQAVVMNHFHKAQAEASKQQNEDGGLNFQDETSEVASAEAGKAIGTSLWKRFCSKIFSFFDRAFSPSGDLDYATWERIECHREKVAARHTDYFYPRWM